MWGKFFVKSAPLAAMGFMIFVRSCLSTYIIAVLFYLADIPEEDEYALLKFSIGANSATGAMIKMKPYNLLTCARLIIRSITIDDNIRETVDAKYLRIEASKRGQDFSAFSDYCKASGLSNMAGMIVLNCDLLR